MRPFERLPAPNFLAENWERWGEEYAARKTANPKFKFTWYKAGYQQVNHRILPDLQAQTEGHCSYCDLYPSRLGDDSIEHFKPKGRAEFYRLAYQWENLYTCCWHCQQAKGEDFDHALLRPDEPGYTFERYFIFNFSTDEIEIHPNPDATAEEKHRAETTINLLGMNEKGQPRARMREWRAYDRRVHGDLLDDYAFRFLLE